MRRETWIPLAAACCLTALPLGCDVAVSVGDGNANQNSNDNVVDNTNVNDNTVDNTNDNTTDGGDDTSTYARFQDPDSEFSTTNVRDVDEEIVRFDTATQGVVYAATDRVYDEGQWPVNDVFLGRGGPFQVRFGTKDGQRRTYFTETATATICNFVVSETDFQIFLTNTPVPQE